MNPSVRFRRLNCLGLRGESLRFTAILILILAASIIYLYFYRFQSIERTTQEKTFTLKMSVTYKNGGTSIWNLTEEDYAIGLFCNNTWQKVSLTDRSLPIRSFERDEDGNHIAILVLPEKWLPPEASSRYEVKFRIITRPRSIPDIGERHSQSLDDIPKALKEGFCGSEGPWQIGDPKLIDLAKMIVGNETNVLSIVTKFVRWIRINIHYRTSELPRYPNETLKDRFGDCDDQANLLVTLCRIYEIPAYLQIGCMYLPDEANTTSRYWGDHYVYTLMKVGWHGWAMVYIPPWGWLPVDLTYATDISRDPLNAIKRSAVTLQRTIQYMNITKTDYIASSKSFRSFLIRYDFYVYEYDEMREEVAPGIGKRESELNPRILAVKPILLKCPSNALKLEPCEGL